MASYKPKQSGLIRDYAWASQIAAQRPLLAPRIQCELDYREERELCEASIRGDQGYKEFPPSEPPSGPRDGDIMEDRVALFNRQLRGGHSQMEHDEE